MKVVEEEVVWLRVVGADDVVAGRLVVVVVDNEVVGAREEVEDDVVGCRMW